MGLLNQMSSPGLYSSEPPYYTYGAPQVPLQPATPPQGNALAQQQRQPQRLAKGGNAQKLDQLRAAAEMPDVSDDPDPSMQSSEDQGTYEPTASDPFVQGDGSGRDDTVDALLSDGEYVFDAETVAMLGDGSSKEGARKLDELRARIREHKGAALAKGEISPDAKEPEDYLIEEA